MSQAPDSPGQRFWPSESEVKNYILRPLPRPGGPCVSGPPRAVVQVSAAGLLSLRCCSLRGVGGSLFPLLLGVFVVFRFSVSVRGSLPARLLVCSSLPVLRRAVRRVLRVPGVDFVCVHRVRGVCWLWLPGEGWSVERLACWVWLRGCRPAWWGFASVGEVRSSVLRWLREGRLLGFEGCGWRWSPLAGWFRCFGGEWGEVAPSSSFVLVGSPSVSCVVGGLSCRSASRSFVARFVSALRGFRRFRSVSSALVPVSAPVPVGSPSVVCFVSLSRPPLSLPVVLSCSPAGVSALVASLRACLAPRSVAS